MCRIAILTPECPDVDFKDYFDELVASMGGDGNGLAVLGPKIRIVKGLDVTTDKCAAMAYDGLNAGYTVVFHTRRASVGPRCDELCMPFLVGPDQVLVHNGGWPTYHGAMWALMDELPSSISDTLVLATAYATWGPRIMNHVTAGVVVTASAKTIRVWSSGIFSFFVSPGLYASELPVEVHGTPIYAGSELFITAGKVEWITKGERLPTFYAYDTRKKNKPANVRWWEYKSA